MASKSTKRRVTGAKSTRRKRGTAERTTARARTSAKAAKGAGHSRAAGTQGARTRTTKARRTRTTGTASRGRVHRDAIGVLKEDHVRLRDLLGRLPETATAAQRERLLTTTRDEIERHTRIEEEIFYPAFRNLAEREHDRELYHEAIEEHHAASLVLQDLTTSLDEAVFAARAKVLRELVVHHAQEEERELFARARAIMPREELVRLGAELTERKRFLASSGSSGGALETVASLVRMPFSSS